MIKINDKIWAVIHSSRAPLAYMCQVTEKTDGTPDNATQKMQATGRGWATDLRVSGSEAYYDNVPVTGVVIGDSVSRWTTDNKLFRVLDPRGFEVEVPTGNIAALLKYRNVKNGVIQEECVWGREGNSHLLLPVNSEPYIEAKKVLHQVAHEMLKASDLNLGDRVKVMSQGNVGKLEFEFFGIVKLSWLRRCSNNQYRSTGYYRTYYTDLVQSVPLDDEVIQDDKWVAVLGRQDSTCDYSKPYGPEREATRRTIWVFTYELNPKIIERVAGEPSFQFTPEIAMQKDHQYAPERVTKRFKHKTQNYSRGEDSRIVGNDSIVGVEFKKKR